MKGYLLSILICGQFLAAGALALPNKIALNLSKSSTDGSSVRKVFFSNKGNTDGVSSNTKKATTNYKSYKNLIISLKKDGQQGASPVVYAIKKSSGKLQTVKSANSDGCESGDKAIISLTNIKKAASKLSSAKKKLSIKLAKVGSTTKIDALSNIGSLRRAFDRKKNLVSVDSNCAPIGLGNLGAIRQSQSSALADTDDSDGDGLTNDVDTDDDNDGIPDDFDIDDDGDGILDNDDADFNQEGELDPFASIRLFSNFHLDFEDTVNANAATIVDSTIDQLLVDNAGLAIPVAGDDSDSVELDCGVIGSGGLSYCADGGSGRSTEPFPDGLKFPEDFDDDDDGYGTIVNGSSGDFQLKPNANSSEIQAGDVLVERVTDSEGGEKQVPGMLNFIFHTVPAVKQVVTSVSTYNVTYPVTAGDSGTPTNCFQVPATGTVEVTFTVYRPQRKGISGAGEASLVNMGNLKLITNLPNAPCTPDMNGQCTGGSGPGLCASSTYSNFGAGFNSPALTSASDGLQDNLGDVDATPGTSDSGDTFTYKIDITQCLSNAGISWSSGEKLSYPVQMMNVFGDNAAQNICFIRQ
ncbi:MAG: hypothetical protein H6619_00155 [Deltaproteobacteria bacterium]|nr:hypothetical protein [Deltaproteobacteria bacterium]